MYLENVLVKPLITEKVSEMTESSNKYGFEVALKANKHQIKDAIQKLYNVKVESVATSIRPGKLKRAGKQFKKTSKTKRAFVKLAEGQRIELFKGV